MFNQIEQLTDLNVIDPQQRTPIHLAARHLPSLLPLLIKKGTTPCYAHN